VLAELERIGIAVDKNDSRIGRLPRGGQGTRGAGYAYEARKLSSFWRACSASAGYFDVEQFESTSSSATTARQALSHHAVVKVKVEGRRSFPRGGQRPGQIARRRRAQGHRQVPAFIEA